jgi:dihydropyrimidinase
MIADMAGVPLYVVHTSCEQAHEAIRRARQKGMRVYGEPLIQHLVLDETEYFNKDWDHAARRVMSPPFRNKQHQDSLWAGLQSGSLQVVATDHCAFTTAQKRTGIGNFAKIPNGTGGLEDRMPVLWTKGVNTGRLTMNEFVAVTSTNIAKILNCIRRRARCWWAPMPISWSGTPSARRPSAPRQAAVGHRLQRVRGHRGDRPAALSCSRAERLRSTEGQGQTKPGHGQFVGREPHMAVNRRCRPGRKSPRRARWSAPAFRRRG